jgi:hypothetical protein
VSGTRETRTKPTWRFVVYANRDIQLMNSPTTRWLDAEAM